jgi:hypothetical protein
MGDVEALIDIVLSQRQTLVTLGMASLALVPLVMSLGIRARWSWWRLGSAGLAGLGTALVLATTLGRYEVGVSFDLGRLRYCLVQPGLSMDTPEEMLNGLLFAPACFFAVLAVRRTVVVFVAAAALSALVEVAQSATGLGTCQTSDVIRNLAGAGVATLVGLAAVKATEGLPHHRTRP